MLMRKIVKELMPPIFLKFLKSIYRKSNLFNKSANEQNLEVYWNKGMAEILETWGEGNVWDEIQFLMVNCSGKILDIACGTGKTVEILSSKFHDLDIYGIDISDFLIEKAIQRGISKDKVLVGNATSLPYPNKYFDYSFSIGSLEHFTEEGIMKFLLECIRVTKKASFHFIPISKSLKDEGWITTMQSYFNNSHEWWLTKFRHVSKNIKFLRSKWEDSISYGYWFIMSHE